MNREILAAVFSGLLFGAGLAISGMADPVRVRGFLDIFGNWDPTLVFVMGGAVLVMAIAWVIWGRMTAPLLRADFLFLTKLNLMPLWLSARSFLE